MSFWKENASSNQKACTFVEEIGAILEDPARRKVREALRSFGLPLSNAIGHNDLEFALTCRVLFGDLPDRTAFSQIALNLDRTVYGIVLDGQLIRSLTLISRA